MKQNPFSKQELPVDIMQAPSGQSTKSNRLSNLKKRLDMKDGDEHFLPIAVGPINDMYLQIRHISAFPFGAGKMDNLIHDTTSNRR
jgi:hypothetical protein